jgi:acyl-homoserine lactone acylase PvdQ
MTLTALAATGRLCEHLGYRPSLMALDHTARSLRFDRPDPPGSGSVPEDSLLTAYLEGVARVFRTGRRPLSLRLARVGLEAWDFTTLSAVVRFVAYSLSSTQGAQEMAILKAVASGPEYRAAWQSLLPDAFVAFDPEALSGLTIRETPCTVVTPTSAARQSPAPSPAAPPGTPASNNWAVGPARSANGSVIFCNDPHLAVNQLPGFWYQAEIITPDLYTLGFGVPGTPLFPGGWNGSVAWGVTHAVVDGEDLVIEECRDGKVRRADGWMPVVTRDEYIRVRGASDEHIRVHEIDGGILLGDPQVPGRYLQRRWAGASSSVGPTMTALAELLFADSASAAADAVSRAEAVDLNWVMGDRHGGTSYQLSGRPLVHEREHSGILPCAGWSPQYTPARVAEPDELPRESGGPDACLVTANQRIAVAGYRVFQSLPFSDHRAERIREVLHDGYGTGAPMVDPALMQRLQYDVYSRQAERILHACEPYLPPEAEKLRAWDRRYTAESRTATLFDAFRRELFTIVVTDTLAPAGKVREIFDGGGLSAVSHDLVERWYGRNDGPFGTVDWKTVVARAYERAVRATRRPRPWGAVNRLVMRHQILGHSLLGPLVNDGPHRYGGCGTTVFQGYTYHHGKAREHTTGPTYHLIVDFGEPAAYTNIASGRTERAGHPHYRLGIASWLTARYERFVPPSEEDFH